MQKVKVADLEKNLQNCLLLREGVNVFLIHKINDLWFFSVFFSFIDKFYHHTTLRLFGIVSRSSSGC